MYQSLIKAGITFTKPRYKLQAVQLFPFRLAPVIMQGVYQYGVAGGRSCIDKSFANIQQHNNSFTVCQTITGSILFIFPLFGLVLIFLQRF